MEGGLGRGIKRKRQIDGRRAGGRGKNLRDR